MRSEVRMPGNCPLNAFSTMDDIGEIPRWSRNVERRAVDDLDPFDIAAGNARQLGIHFFGLVRRPLAVEQHIASRLPQPPQFLAVADLAPRHLRQNVLRVAGLVARAVGEWKTFV